MKVGVLAHPVHRSVNKARCVRNAQRRKRDNCSSEWAKKFIRLIIDGGWNKYEKKKKAVVRLRWRAWTHTQRRVCRMNRANEPYMLILWCAHLRRARGREWEIWEPFRHHFHSRIYKVQINWRKTKANSILLCECVHVCVWLYTKPVIFIAFKSVFPLSAGATCIPFVYSIVCSSTHSL